MLKLVLVNTTEVLGVITLTKIVIIITAIAIAAVLECHEGKYETKLGTEPDLCSNPEGQQTFSVKGQIVNSLGFASHMVLVETVCGLRQYVKEWTWLCSKKSLFTEVGGRFSDPSVINWVDLCLQKHNNNFFLKP